MTVLMLQEPDIVITMCIVRKHRPNHTVYTGVLGGQPVFQLAAASSTKISAPPFAAGGL
jgi:hypothetical protein